MKKITRRETRKRLDELYLACELVKMIKHLFPGLINLLKYVKDPRNKSYCTYESQTILMTRILSAVFYINSMRKTSEEFNNQAAIVNIGILCGQEGLDEIPHWSTINNFLENLEPKELEGIIPKLVNRLIRIRSFLSARIRDKYWQILIDGTQLYAESRKLGVENSMDDRCLKREHKNPDGSIKYIDYYYYVIEAKLILHEKIVVSIATEFAENKDIENYKNWKQDCELKATYRIMEKINNYFPKLPICLTMDSLYAGEPFFLKCVEKGWHYIVRFKEKKIPYITNEYKELIKLEQNEIMGLTETGHKWNCNYVVGIHYNGVQLNMVCYQQSDREYPFLFVTNLPVTKKNQITLVQYGRRRWKIENEGFDIQKRHGNNLEHRYSKNYTAMKNHYYLIQIGHMIAQMMENWKKLWKNTKVSMDQKHRRLLEGWKQEIPIWEEQELDKPIQIRFLQSN